MEIEGYCRLTTKEIMNLHKDYTNSTYIELGYDVTEYYALINYRGVDRIYKIIAEDLNSEKNDYCLRIQYISYDPNRAFDGVWVKKRKNEVKKVFLENSEEYQYFKKLEDVWYHYIDEKIDFLRRVYKNPKIVTLGILDYKDAYKKAFKEVSLPQSLKNYKF